MKISVTVKARDEKGATHSYDSTMTVPTPAGDNAFFAGNAAISNAMNNVLNVVGGAKQAVTDVVVKVE